VTSPGYINYPAELKSLRWFACESGLLFISTMQRPLRSRPASVTLLAVFSVAIFLLGVLQIRHHLQYGHFVRFGLHADLTVSDAETGIPGSPRLFDAHLTNFGLFPEKVVRCEFISDAGGHGVRVAYRLEQLDTGTRSWKTLTDAAQSYCRPFPLGVAQSKVVDELLSQVRHCQLGLTVRRHDST
jgi:hypothetical protein